jgi:hypothetical protein
MTATVIELTSPFQGGLVIVQNMGVHVTLVAGLDPNKKLVPPGVVLK